MTEVGQKMNFKDFLIGGLVLFAIVKGLTWFSPSLLEPRPAPTM